MVSTTSLPGAWLLRFRVTPLMTPVTVLLVLLMGTPSTVSDALTPVAARVNMLADEVLGVGWMVKSLALPEALATRATRAPLASDTTLAVTPRLRPLMYCTRSLGVFTPLPTAMVVVVCELPEPMVKSKLPGANGVLPFATESEYQAAVAARFCTTTTWLPAAVPAAAVADTTPGCVEVMLLDISAPRGSWSESRLSVNDEA